MGAPAAGSGTARTTPSRMADRASHDLVSAREILADTLVGHVGMVHADGAPLVLPVAVAPDGDRVLFHGSTGSRMFRALAAGAPACLTITHLDGLVLARSAFESSMNYRCLVVLGTAEVLQGTEKEGALRTLTEHLTPGRWESLRPMTAKEVSATTVLALPLTEFSVKVRTGGPEDPEDSRWPIWAGHVPLRVTADDPVPEPDSADRARPEAPKGVR